MEINPNPIEEKIIKLYEERKTLETISNELQINRTTITSFISRYYAENAENASAEEIVDTYLKHKDFREVKMKYGVTKKELAILVRRNQYKRKSNYIDEEDSIAIQTERKMNIIHDYEEGITLQEIKQKYQRKTLAEVRSILLEYYQNLGKKTIKKQLSETIVEEYIQQFIKQGRTLPQIYQALQETKKIIPKSIKDKYFKEMIEVEKEENSR